MVLLRLILLNLALVEELLAPERGAAAWCYCAPQWAAGVWKDPDSVETGLPKPRLGAPVATRRASLPRTAICTRHALSRTPTAWDRGRGCCSETRDDQTLVR